MDKRKQLRVECIHSRYKIFNYIYFCFVICVLKCFNFKFLKLERKLNPFILQRTSLVAQTVKRLPTMRDTQVRSLGQEDPLKKAMATHSGTLAWRIPWMEEPGGLQSVGSQRVRHYWATSLSQLLSQSDLLFLGRNSPWPQGPSETPPHSPRKEDV